MDADLSGGSNDDDDSLDDEDDDDDDEEDDEEENGLDEDDEDLQVTGRNAAAMRKGHAMNANNMRRAAKNQNESDSDF